MAGDYNAKHIVWSNKFNDERGNNLFNWLESNDIKYKSKLLHFETPFFPRNESFIDLVITDARLEMPNTKLNKLPTISISSDHTAILMEIRIPNQSLVLFPAENNTAFNYSKAKWDQFQSRLRVYKPNINACTNLSIPQIDKFISEITNKIVATMQGTIPKMKSQNAT